MEMFINQNGWIAIIIGLCGLLIFPFIRAVYRKYFKGADLKIEMKLVNEVVIPMNEIRVLHNTDNSETYIKTFKATWSYEMTIINNSSSPAYNTVFSLLQPFPLETKFEPNQKLEIIHNTTPKRILAEIQYVFKSERSTSYTYKRKKFPEQLNGFTMLFTYVNEHKGKFFTICKIQDGDIICTSQNSFKRGLSEIKTFFDIRKSAKTQNLA